VGTWYSHVSDHGESLDRVLSGYGTGRIGSARAASTAAATLLQRNDRHASHNSRIHENAHLNPSIGVFGNLHGQSNQLLTIRFGVIEEVNALKPLGCGHGHRIYRCFNNASAPPLTEGIAVVRQPDQRIQFANDAYDAKGTTGIQALQSIDIAVRHPESFAAMQDAIA